MVFLFGPGLWFFEDNHRGQVPYSPDHVKEHTINMSGFSKEMGLIEYVWMDYVYTHIIYIY